MTDPRVTPDPGRIDQHSAAAIRMPVSDLCRTAQGKRDRQLLFGDRVEVLSEDHGWSYVQSAKDGYCGFVKTVHLGPPTTVTHRVTALATHSYLSADFKSPDRMSLSLGSRIAATGTVDTFVQTAAGFIPSVHLSAIEVYATDPADVAALFLGTPYLWGGNSREGIDCSGLVQAALLACGLPCPGDSDQQEAQVFASAKPQTGYLRNDLLFWKGHVALVTDKDRLIHANAHSMSVAYEPIADSIARIAAQEGGPVTAHKRR